MRETLVRFPGSGRSPGEGIGYPLQHSWASLVAELVKNPPECRRPQFDSWVRKIRWRRDRLPTPAFLGFPGGSDGKESAFNVRDLGSIPGLGRSSGREQSNLLQYSCLENRHGQRILAGYSSWDHKELDMTETLHTIQLYPLPLSFAAPSPHTPLCHHKMPDQDPCVLIAASHQLSIYT